MNNETNDTQINIRDTKECSCGNCGYSIFLPAVSMREVPADKTKSGKIEYAPVTVVVCLKCQKPFERPAPEPSSIIVPGQ